MINLLIKFENEFYEEKPKSEKLLICLVLPINGKEYQPIN